MANDLRSSIEAMLTAPPPSSAGNTTAELTRAVRRASRGQALMRAGLLAAAVTGLGAGSYAALRRTDAPFVAVAPATPVAGVATSDPVPERAPRAGGRVATRGAPAGVTVLMLRVPESAASDAPATIGLRARPVDPFELARTIAEDKRGAVQLCYERELKRDPRLRGAATVTLHLRAPHRVAGVDVVDNLGRPSFGACVRSSMRTVDFPPLAEDLAIEIPFALTSPGF